MLNSQVNPVTTYCPTGNCTWPITPSLAVCGHCAPTTFKTDCEEPNFSFATCSFTTASGASVQLGQPGTNLSIGFQVVLSGNLSKTDKWYLSQIDMLGAPFGIFDWTVSDIQASSCQLWFCVNAYNISVYNSNQSQTITQSFHEFEASNYFWNADRPGGGFTGSKQFLPLPSAMNPIPGVVYGMNTLSAEGFSNVFQSLATGSVTINESSFSADKDCVQAIWENSANPDYWIQRVALSLTNSFRSGGARGSQLYQPQDHYNGTAYHTVFIIRWYWIILPGTMVVLSLLFLVIVITKTARSDIVSWKGSLLTFLLFSVDASIREAAAGTADLNDGFEDAVGHRTVVLSGDAGDFRQFRDV
jgi:hypothetical protein